MLPVPRKRTESRKDTYCSYIIQTSPHHNINFTFNDDFFVPCHKSGGVYQSGDYVEDRNPLTVWSVSSGDPYFDQRVDPVLGSRIWQRRLFLAL